jgi:hypothetical protein
MEINSKGIPGFPPGLATVYNIRVEGLFHQIAKERSFKVPDILRIGAMFPNLPAANPPEAFYRPPYIVSPSGPALTISS